MLSAPAQSSGPGFGLFALGWRERHGRSRHGWGPQGSVLRTPVPQRSCLDHFIGQWPGNKAGPADLLNNR